MIRKTIDLVNQMDDSAATPDDVFEAIHSVMHLYRSHQYRGLRDGTQELTHMDGKVLGFFSRHPGATQKQLAEKSGRDKSQLARLIAGLKERGLLDATPDETDRRNIRLQLTDEGRKVQQALQRQSRKLSDQAVASLSEADRQQLLSLLGKVKANLVAANAEAPPLG